MSSPPTFDPIADARTRPRYLARAAIVAPFAALAIMWVARQLERDQSASITSAINIVGSAVSFLFILAGIGLGITAIVGGLRRGSRDTVIIAAIGLLLSSGFLLLTAYAFIYLQTAR